MIKCIAIAIILMPRICLAGEASDKCFDHLYAMPALAPIASKMAIPDVNKATFEQLANQEKATDQEKPLIAKLAEGVKICVDLEMQSMPSNVYPPSRKAVEDNATRRTSSLIDLYNQKISYGEYVKQRQESGLQFRREIDKTDMEIAEYNRNVDASNAQIDAQRRAMERQQRIDMLQGISDGIKRSMPPRSLNCTSTAFGGSVNTTCR